MSKVPSVALEEIMASRNGSIDPAGFPDEVFDLYSIPAYDSGTPDVVVGSQIGSSKQIVQPGDVLLSRIVPHIRRAWVVGKRNGRRVIASGEWIVFRNERADPAYLRRALMSDEFHTHFMATVAGVGGSLMRARPAYVAKIKIPLPPLAEQKRIAAILDQADAVRRKRQHALQLADDLLPAAFFDMFGDPVLNKKNWRRLVLSDLLHGIESGKSPKCLDRVVGGGEWGILKLGAVTYCKYQPQNNKAIPDSEDPDPSLEVMPGDVLFTRKNTYDLIAACAFVYETPRKLMLPDLIFRFRIREDAPLLGEYLWGLLTHPRKRKTIQSLAGGSAGSMPNISKAKLLKVEIEVPPLDQQKRFASVMHQSYETGKKLRLQTLDQDAFFHSLVQRAFRGEL